MHPGLGGSACSLLSRVVVPPAELDGRFPENAVSLALTADPLVLDSGVLEKSRQHRRQQVERFLIFETFGGYQQRVGRMILFVGAGPRRRNLGCLGQHRCHDHR